MALSEFISKYKGNLSRLTDNITSGNLKAIEGSLERLEQIESQQNVTKYRLVFIGKPGSGKTTTICNYLNLTVDVEVGDKLERLELFDTASGRTTAAEVHFQKSDRTAIIVHPMDVSQQQVLIKEYCADIWKQAFPSDSDEEQQEQDVSIEYERIIQNMLGYETSGDFVDYVIENYTEDEFERFIENTLEIIAISFRTQTEFIPTESDNIKTWLQKTFTCINKGHAKNVCIPDQIDVLLNPEDIDFFIPDFVSEVIDTRGYDGNAREDLRDYLEANDTICVILDEVKALPGEIQRKILTEWVDKGQNDIINRIVLLVKVKDDELADVNEADGDAEIGEKNKRNELRRAIISKKLNYRLENTLFIDSYEGIEIERKQEAGSKKRVRTVVSYNHNERISQREKITAHFTKIIQNHRKTLSDEADTLQKDITQMYEVISTPSKSRVFAHKLEEISTKITTVNEILQGDIEKALNESERQFCDFFRYQIPIHWRSAKKTTALEGYWRNANVYNEYADYCERIIKRECYSRKVKIIEFIGLLKECDAPSDDIEAFINSCITTVDVRYNQMIRSSRSVVINRCKSAFTATFWMKAQNVSGGTGYYGRLMDTFIRQMIQSDLCSQTVSDVQKQIDQFIFEIIQTLNSNPKKT